MTQNNGKPTSGSDAEGRGRYFLDLVEGNRVTRDETGIELHGDAILDEARRAAAWIAAGYREGERPSAAFIVVRNASGQMVAEIPVTTLGS